MMTLIKGRLLLALTDVEQVPFKKSEILKIIIFRYDRIGDLIVSLPLIEALRAMFPQSEIVIIGSSANASIAEISAAVDKVVVKKANFFLWILQLLKLRNENPNLVVDLNHSVAPHTILAARIINAPHVASPYKDGRWNVKGTSLKLFNIMPSQNRSGYDRPISEIYLDIARSLGYTARGKYPYPLPKFPKPSHLPDSFIVLNPCGSRSSMQIKKSDLLAITDQIARHTPEIRILIPAIRENFHALKSLFETKTNVLVSNPSPTIIPTLIMIQHAHLVITPDTALVHIACAYSTKLIAIYTSDEKLFQQWRPLNKSETHIIRSKEPKGLAGYSPDELMNAVNNVAIGLAKIKKSPSC